MPSIDTDGGLDSITLAVNALNNSITSAQAAMTALNAQLVIAQATIATLNAGNYYTRAEVDGLVAARAPATHTHTISQISNAGALGQWILSTATQHEGRQSLGLGTAATMDASAFVATGAIEAHNTAGNAHIGLTSPKEYRITYTDSSGNSRTLASTSIYLSTATWQSLFPATGIYAAAPSVAIGGEWTLSYDAALGGMRASKSRSDVVV